MEKLTLSTFFLLTALIVIAMGTSPQSTKRTGSKRSVSTASSKKTRAGSATSGKVVKRKPSNKSTTKKSEKEAKKELERKEKEDNQSADHALAKEVLTKLNGYWEVEEGGAKAIFYHNDVDEEKKKKKVLKWFEISYDGNEKLTYTYRSAYHQTNAKDMGIDKRAHDPKFGIQVKSDVTVKAVLKLPYVYGITRIPIYRLEFVLSSQEKEVVMTAYGSKKLNYAAKYKYVKEPIPWPGAFKDDEEGLSKKFSTLKMGHPKESEANQEQHFPTANPPPGSSQAPSVLPPGYNNYPGYAYAYNGLNPGGSSNYIEPNPNEGTKPKSRIDKDKLKSGAKIGAKALKFAHKQYKNGEQQEQQEEGFQEEGGMGSGGEEGGGLSEFFDSIFGSIDGESVKAVLKTLKEIIGSGDD